MGSTADSQLQGPRVNPELSECAEIHTVFSS